MNKTIREKSVQNRRAEKPTSSQRSPFKSKYVADKQHTKISFGHSGLSPKSFSRRHIEDSDTAFYAKPAKLGKVAKELSKHSVEVNLIAKRRKSLKRYSPVHESRAILHPNEDQSYAAALSTSSRSRPSSLEKSSSCSPDNPPQHRKCYTNSKRAEFTKHLKLLDKGVAIDVKISQHGGDLKNSGSSSDELKYASINDTHSHKDTDDTPNQDLFFKGNTYENTQSEQLSINSTGKPLIQAGRQILTVTSNPNPNANNVDINAICNQTRRNSNYFYKGTENKMNLGGSDISGVKILLRGDLLGALNCLFPQLNLIASGEPLKDYASNMSLETNPKRPLLDPNFSYFSESSDILIETFALARKLYNEQRKNSGEFHKQSLKEKVTEFSNTPQDERPQNKYLYEPLPQHAADNKSHNCDNSVNRTQSLNLLKILSAKEIHTPFVRESKEFKYSNGNSSPNVLKCSQSEPRITEKGAAEGNIIKISSENNVKETRQMIPTVLERNKNHHNLETLGQIENNQNFEYHKIDQEGCNPPTTNNNQRSLYSSVLKNSMFKKDFAPIYSKIIYPAIDSGELCDSSLEILTSSNKSFSNETNDNRPNLEPPKPPICYDLDELEKDITKSLEKILDEPEDLVDPLMLNLDKHLNTMPFYEESSNFSTQFNPTQAQKYNEANHHKFVAVDSGINSLQSRLNFLRTKGRPSDFEQFFNPVTFNTQFTAQLIRQENITGNLKATQMDNNINQLFPKYDLSKICTSGPPYFRQNSTNTFQRDIKELLMLCPQIVQNMNSEINQHTFLNPNSDSVAASSQLDFASLYPHLAETKAQVPPSYHVSPMNNAADESMILNRFITSQNLDCLYPNNTDPGHYQKPAQKFEKNTLLEYTKPSPMENNETGVMNPDRFPTTSYTEARSCEDNANTTIRTIISVSDLEKQALEQYQNSEESINARYEILEKEAEEQYNNCLSQK